MPEPATEVVARLETRCCIVGGGPAERRRELPTRLTQALQVFV